MTWKTSVTLDDDKSDVGNVSTIFTDTDATTFVYTSRVRANVAGRDSFCAAAVAARNAWRTRKTAEAGFNSNIDTRFVALDP